MINLEEKRCDLIEHEKYQCVSFSTYIPNHLCTLKQSCMARCNLCCIARVINAPRMLATVLHEIRTNGVVIFSLRVTARVDRARYRSLCVQHGPSSMAPGDRRVEGAVVGSASRGNSDSFSGRSDHRMTDRRAFNCVTSNDNARIERESRCNCLLLGQPIRGPIASVGEDGGHLRVILSEIGSEEDRRTDGEKYEEARDPVTILDRRQISRRVREKSFGE